MTLWRPDKFQHSQTKEPQKMTFAIDPAKLLAATRKKQDAIKQRAKTIKPNPGANRYVLLGGWREGESEIFYHDFGQHFIKNAADEIQAIYPCLNKTYGEPCPVCAGLATALRQSPDEETTEVLKKAAASGTYLLNVLELDGREANTPQILEVKKTVFGQILDMMNDWGTAIFDPENPQIITINREGKGLNTKYTVQISAKKIAMPADAYKNLNNLDDYVRQANEEQEKRAIAAINGVAGLISSAPKTTASAMLGRSTSAESATTVEDVAVARAAEASRPSASQASLDAELDDLLADVA